MHNFQMGLPLDPLIYIDIFIMEVSLRPFVIFGDIRKPRRDVARPLTLSRGVYRGGWRRSPLCGLLSLPDKIKEKIESKYQKNETNLSFFATFL